MKIKPLADRILVKPLDAAEKTQGGIYIPQTAQEKTQEAEVVAVGEGKPLDNGQISKMPVKVKDKIIHDKYSGTNIKIDGADHIIIKAEDVLAVIE